MKAHNIANVRGPALATVLVFLFASGCTATGGEGEVAATSDRECRSFAQIGTKMRKSICQSKATWAVIDAQVTADELDNEKFRDEIFRRAIEQAAQGQGQAFSTP